MLQQTQVDRVLPKYEEWLTRYPSLDALAGADEADVVQTWRPLGYNIRPRRLQAIAREAVERYDGRLPSDEATLRSFKGIGPYTAGAIMSFAFRQRAAIVDTNVARVLYRIFVGDGDPKAHAMKAHLWDVSRAVLPHRHVFDFNQALMDFGATVCSARKPLCEACPMARGCVTSRQQRHQPGVGFREWQARELGRADPAQLLPEQRLRLAVDRAVVEVQLDALAPDSRASSTSAGGRRGRRRRALRRARARGTLRASRPDRPCRPGTPTALRGACPSGGGPSASGRPARRSPRRRRWWTDRRHAPEEAAPVGMATSGSVATVAATGGSTPTVSFVPGSVWSRCA